MYAGSISVFLVQKDGFLAGSPSKRTTAKSSASMCEVPGHVKDSSGEVLNYLLCSERRSISNRHGFQLLGACS